MVTVPHCARTYRVVYKVEYRLLQPITIRVKIQIGRNVRFKSIDRLSALACKSFSTRSATA